MNETAHVANLVLGGGEARKYIGPTLILPLCAASARASAGTQLLRRALGRPSGGGVSLLRISDV